MDRQPIELGTFHHIYNRGTEKRQIFMDDEDYHRFLLYINVLNNLRIENPSKLEEQGKLESYKVDHRLVELSAFTLMPNHFHLLLYELTVGGISKFMQRLGTAYTVYFNEKYERGGALFQGRYKSKNIFDESYLLYLINYIHLNPKDVAPIKSKLSFANLLDFLETYRWSSYMCYLNNNNGKLIQRDALTEYVDLRENYREKLLELYDDAAFATEVLEGLTFEETARTKK